MNRGAKIIPLVVRAALPSGHLTCGRMFDSLPPLHRANPRRRLLQKDCGRDASDEPFISRSCQASVAGGCGSACDGLWLAER